jgi:hypothetical protein
MSVLRVTEPVGTELGSGVPTWNNGNVQGQFLPDLRRAFRQLFTLVGNAYIGAPIGTPSVGSTIFFDFTQDATGSRVITWDPIYRDPPAWGSSGPALSNAAGEFRFTSQGAWQYVGGSSAWAVQGEGLPVPSGAMLLFTGSPVLLPIGLTLMTPTVGALSLAGVAPGFQRNTIVTRTPTVGSITLAGLGLALVPPSGAVIVVGQNVTRSP